MPASTCVEAGACAYDLVIHATANVKRKPRDAWYQRRAFSKEDRMLNRRHLLGALTLSATLSLGSITLGSITWAMDKKPFDRAAFEAAQAAGKPILIEVSAPWCPTSKAQAPILSRLRNDPRFKDLVSLNIDFDSQKDLLKKFNVQMQSTFIVFKGKQETGRSTGDTNAGSIEALLGTSI
jgi:thioredoxin